MTVCKEKIKDRLSTLERIRVAAALGQSVTFDAKSVPNLLEYFKSSDCAINQAKKFHEDAKEAYAKSIKNYRKNIRDNIILCAFNLFILGIVVWIQ